MAGSGGGGFGGYNGGFSNGGGMGYAGGAPGIYSEEGDINNGVGGNVKGDNIGWNNNPGGGGLWGKGW
jgi:hypothetical protein